MHRKCYDVAELVHISRQRLVSLRLKISQDKAGLSFPLDSWEEASGLLMWILELHLLAIQEA